MSFHLSGGTGEILATQGCRPVCVIGGIRDLSFGQLIDRAGVALGLGFPAGAALDRIVCRTVVPGSLKYSSRGNTKIGHPVTGPIHVEGAYANLSGIETQILREIGNLKKRKDRETVSGKIRSLDEDTLFSGKDGEEARRESELSAEERRLAAELFCPDGGRSSAAVRQALFSPRKRYHHICRRSFRESISEKRVGRQTQKTGISGSLRRSGKSSDNACGIARLGVAEYLRTHRKELDEKSKRMTK